MDVSRGKRKIFQAIIFYIVWIFKSLNILPIQKVKFLKLKKKKK